MSPGAIFFGNEDIKRNPTGNCRSLKSKVAVSELVMERVLLTGSPAAEALISIAEGWLG